MNSNRIFSGLFGDPQKSLFFNESPIQVGQLTFVIIPAHDLRVGLRTNENKVCS